MAAAAIAGAVLVSVPLVVNQRSNAEQATRAVGDIPASAPVATLGERGGATWPSVQGGTGKEFPEPAERLQQPPGVLPSKTAPGLPDPVDTSGYQPPLIRPTDEKATGKDRAKDRKADDARPDRPLGAIPRPVWSNHVDSSNRPDTTTLDSGRTPRTVLAASDTTADPKPRPAVRRTARSDSGTRTATPRAAAPRVKAAAPAPAPAPASASAPKKKTTAVRATPTAKEGQTKVLHGTYVIGRGQSVATNRISLTMQQNGSLVILDSNGRARWSSGTSGRGDRAVFQGDGNLVVLAADGTAVWSSRTDGNPGAELVLQNDGNVTIQAAAWQVPLGQRHPVLIAALTQGRKKASVRQQLPGGGLRAVRADAPSQKLAAQRVHHGVRTLVQAQPVHHAGDHTLDGPPGVVELTSHFDHVPSAA